MRKELRLICARWYPPARRRLKPEMLAVTIAGKSIADVVLTPVEELTVFFDTLSKDKDLTVEQKLIIERVRKEAVARIGYLLDVGLGYLNLDRTSMTLSGGEAQRVRLATQLGSQLSGVIYILDEPSIGLHPRDNDKLINTVKHLRDLGNTAIVVEHDKAMMMAADYLIDIGPGAGLYGGELVAAGTPAEVAKNKHSLTGQYLSDRKAIPTPKSYRKGSVKDDHRRSQGLQSKKY